MKSFYCIIHGKCKNTVQSEGKCPDSQYAFSILENFEEEMAVNGKKPAIFYRREGNLFLYREEAIPAARRAFEMQKALGCAIEWWIPEQVREHYPIYENLTGINAATFGPEDGHFDAYAVLMAFKTKAQSLGAEFIQEEVRGLLINAQNFGEK